MVTSRDVARAAGVSQATVSRVLSNGVVSDATRLRVTRAMESTGYSPNLTARAMRTGLSRTVGIVVADLGNPFYPLMLESLSAAFDAAGYRVVVWVASDSRNAAALDAISQRSIDGVVFTTVTENSPELRSALDRGSPVVLVNRALPEIDCDQVSSDNVAGGAAIADYFVRSGRVAAGFVGGSPDATTSRARLQGFSARLRELGHPLDPLRVSDGEYSYASGRAQVDRLLHLDSPPDAIFCSNDLLALGGLDAARARGVTVPGDLWIAGYDDIPMAAWEPYSLTTIRQDVSATATTAARLLIERIEGAVRPSVAEQFAPELVVRGSTGWTASEASTGSTGSTAPR